MKAIGSISSFVGAMFALLFPGSTEAQHPIRVDLSGIPLVERSPFAHGFEHTCYVKHWYIGFRGDTIVPVYPTLNKNADTLFAAAFFQGHPTERFEHETFIIIELNPNGRRRVFVDLNKNLDFTDDARPIVLHDPKAPIEFWLSNIRNPEARIGYRLTPYNEKQLADTFTISYFTNHYNSIGFTSAPPKFWYTDQNLDCRMKDIVINGDSFRIAIEDGDNDAYFNSKGHDYVLVGEWGKRDMSYSRFAGSETWGDTCMIFHRGNRYYISDIDSLGRWIDLLPTQDSLNRLAVGSLLPDFSFEYLDETQTSIYAQMEEGKYLLIDVWGSWCKPCLLGLPEIIALDSIFADKLVIVGFASDKRTTIEKNVETYQIPYLNTYLNVFVHSQLTSGAFPSYILVGPDKRIISFEAYPEFVKQTLSQ